MILFSRKIFGKQITNFSSLLYNNKTAFWFSPPIKRKQLEQLHSKLILQNQKLQPDATVKLLHFLHFKGQQIEVQNLLTAYELDKIVQNLSSSIFRLGHEQLTLLLQTISQFPKYQTYNRNNEFMKLFIKRLNSIQVIQLQNNYAFRFLNALQKLKFPPLLISKYVNYLVNKQKIKKRGQPEMTQLDCLRFFICILQMNYIPVTHVTKFYEKQIKSMTIISPKQLCYLYYIYRTLQKSINLKFMYFSNKLKLHELVFNPYLHLNEIDSQQQQKIKQKTEEASKQNDKAAESQKQKMKESAGELISELKKKVDIQKLKSQICKHYGFQKYPLQVATALLISDIEQLKPTIQQFFQKNYKKLQPFQFVNLLAVIPNNQRLPYYQQYQKIVWKLLKTYHKLILLKCRQQLCLVKAGTSELIKVIEEGGQITSKQLQILTSIITQGLSSDEQLQILRAVQRVVDQPSNK